MKISIRSTDELIAAIPQILGFDPAESMVLVPLGPEIPMARVDFPATPQESEQAWDSIRPVLSNYAQPGSTVIIVCVTSDQQTADRVSHDFAHRLSATGIATQRRIWAGDARWHDFTTGNSGDLTPTARDTIAATAVLGGHAQPAASREALAASLVGDRESVAQLLPRARDNSEASSPRAEAKWAINRLKKFHGDGDRLSDTDAARLLTAIESPRIRDSLWLDMRRENVTSHIAFWTDLTRRAPDDVRAEPATLLGFAAWLDGNGSLAWTALAQVPPDGRTSLTNLVAETLEVGMHPSEWKDLRADLRQPDTDAGLDPAQPAGRGSHTPPTPKL